MCVCNKPIFFVSASHTENSDYHHYAYYQHGDHKLYYCECYQIISAYMWFQYIYIYIYNNNNNNNNNQIGSS